MCAEATKVCNGPLCKGKEKPASEFHKRSASKDGLQAYCKRCALVAVKKHQSKVGKSIIHRSVKYGLGIDEVLAAVSIPVCQACGTPFASDFEQKFDHCHDGGHFRGVLCHLCNMACAGPSDEAATRLEQCIQYLNRDVERSSEST